MLIVQFRHSVGNTEPVGITDRDFDAVSVADAVTFADVVCYFDSQSIGNFKPDSYAITYAISQPVCDAEPISIIVTVRIEHSELVWDC